MCTLIVFKGIDDRYPLVIAANRDERPSRPTQNPQDLADDIFAPIDLVHGGTWIGVNRRGVIASLTNRFLAPRFRGRRSRGLLVTQALAAGTAADAAAAIMSAPAGIYNGFQLCIDDGRDTALVWSDAERIFCRHLGPGVWIFTGDDDSPGESARADVIRGRMRSGPRLDDLGWLQRLLSFHGPGPEDGTCVHGPGVTMESVFSMIIRRPARGTSWQIDWRAGRPCRTTTWTHADVPIHRTAEGETR